LRDDSCIKQDLIRVMHFHGFKTRSASRKHILQGDQEMFQRGSNRIKQDLITCQSDLISVHGKVIRLCAGDAGKPDTTSTETSGFQDFFNHTDCFFQEPSGQAVGSLIALVSVQTTWVCESRWSARLGGVGPPPGSFWLLCGFNMRPCERSATCSLAELEMLNDFGSPELAQLHWSCFFCLMRGGRRWEGQNTGGSMKASESHS